MLALVPLASCSMKVEMFSRYDIVLLTRVGFLGIFRRAHGLVKLQVLSVSLFQSFGPAPRPPARVFVNKLTVEGLHQ